MTSDDRRRGSDSDPKLPAADAKTAAELKAAAEAKANEPPPDSRRSTMRMRAISASKPAGAPASKPNPAGPTSKPTGAESESYGRIHRMVVWLDANKGAFAISRLISQTGVNLRSFGADTKDDARVLSRLWPLLDVMLSEAEREALFKALREPG